MAREVLSPPRAREVAERLRRELGEPRDDYERDLVAMVLADPWNEQVEALTVRHLLARRQQDALH